MFDLFGLCFGADLRILRTHRSLKLENLALRQQLAVLNFPPDWSFGLTRALVEAARTTAGTPILSGLDLFAPHMGTTPSIEFT